jgi:4-hydroxy-3-polyprenylbenzoate decarboxylase
VLRGARAEIAPALTVPMMVPARAEIVIEGWVHPGETAPEGPFGDHTGYYNAAEPFPVMQISRITCRSDPLYLSTVTGRPPDEPSVIGEVFNDLALPVIRAQIPEVLDLWLPQFSYTKMIVVVDDDIDARNLDDVLWAISTRMDPARDLMVLDGTPMDYLDFASPREGLAGKLGIDATTKIGAETTRDWGRVMALVPGHEARAADLLRGVLA